MQYHWLNKHNNKKLIIFFCGWSFDEKPFERLVCDDYDVLIFYDYKNHEIPVKIPLYEEYYLVTWSMGVYIAYLLRDKLPDFKLKIAINGTPFPVDDKLGIPKRSFELTLKHVDTGLQGKFQHNLFKDEADYEIYAENPVGRKIPEQSEELFAINSYIANAKISYEKYYDYAIIGGADKIVPARNQINCWNGRADIVMLDSGHFPFYSFSRWDEILGCTQT